MAILIYLFIAYAYIFIAYRRLAEKEAKYLQKYGTFDFIMDKFLIHIFIGIAWIIAVPIYVIIKISNLIYNKITKK